ncbi:transcriptional regulator [archaeon SCG-AAA382B04]|nr:transcriptional regulator [archaeon SCG-AAA382B04]
MLMDAISQKNRIKILKQLTNKDHYFSELMNQLNIDGKNLKHHLQKLRQEDIITTYKDGRKKYYSLEKQITLKMTPPPQGKFILIKTEE